MKATFGDRFKQLRTDKGLKQQELVNEFNKIYHYNFTRAAISQYENNKRIPEIDALKAFAEYFNVSVDYLLGNTDVRNISTTNKKISESLDDDLELSEFWNTLKEREDLKLLFKQTKELAPNDIKKIMRIIKAIEDEEDKNDG